MPQLAHAYLSLKDVQAMRLPIVLIHGSTSSGSNLKIGPFNLGPYFKGIPEYLSENGTQVKVVHLPTDGSIAERAAVLKNILESEMKGRMVNIVGHSLGALDARYLVSVLGSLQVSSITSIGTPHHGTPLADWAMAQVQGKGLWYWFFRLLGYDLRQRRFLPEITTAQMKVFNDKVPNSPEVRYYSVRTRLSSKGGLMSPFLWYPAKWLEGQGHPMSANGHDGMVPFDSQLWGTEIGGGALDHLGQLNHHQFRMSDAKQESLALWYAIYMNLLQQGL